MKDTQSEAHQLRESISTPSFITAALTAEDDSASTDFHIPSDTAFVASETGRKEAEKFVSEKAYQLHPIFPFQPLESRKYAQPRSTISYEAQRVELAQTRSARLKRSVTRMLPSTQADLIRCGPLEFQVAHFESVIEAFQQNAKSRELPCGFNIRTTHTWEEVLEAARAAEAKVKADGSKNMFRKAGRGIQEFAPAMSPWLDLIPNGNYTSTLCGSLKIAFGVRVGDDCHC